MHEEERNIMYEYDKMLQNENNKRTFLKRISRAVQPSFFQTNRWLIFKKSTWIIFEGHGSNNNKMPQKVKYLSLNIYIYIYIYIYIGTRFTFATKPLL